MSASAKTTRKNSRSPGRKTGKSVQLLSDDELRAELLSLGVNAGPITATTRSIYQKQLEKRRRNHGNRSSASGSSIRAASHPRNIPNLHDERNFPASAHPTIMTAARSPTSYPTASSSSHLAYSSPRTFDDDQHSNVSKGTYSSTTNYANVRCRPDFSDCHGEKKRNAFENDLSVTDSDNVHDDDDDDDDDDHMESSRILYPMRRHNPAGTGRGFPMQAAFDKFLKMWTSFVLRYKSSRKRSESCRTFRERRSHTLRDGVTPTRSGIFTFDVSQALLYSFVSLFALILVAYLTTANSGAFIRSSRIVYSAAKDTVYFLYMYAILPLLATALACCTFAGIYMLRQYHIKKKAEEKRLTFDLIEKITDIIRDAKEQGQVYIAEPHVRDMILPPSQRMRDSVEWRRWQEAVKFINLNESRVSAETRIVNGVECAVWRWIPAKKNGWQGNAFDGSMQLNVPEQAPSHCLKLRGMFSEVKDMERGTMDVAEALLQKVAPVEPLHVHVEKNSKEGLVFARFASLSDCNHAFRSLHGTWFNGQPFVFPEH